MAAPAVPPSSCGAPAPPFDDVILFPLGLSGLHSTAGSSLPGHVLVTAFPISTRLLPLGVGLVGAIRN